MTKEQFEMAYEAKKLQEQISNEIELIEKCIDEDCTLRSATAANLVSNVLSTEVLSRQWRRTFCIDLVKKANFALDEIETTINEQLELTTHYEEA